MSRNSRPVLTVLLATLVSLVGCSQSEPSRVILALVDGSASRTGIGEYVRGWHQIVESIHPGDRLILGRIRGDAVGFRPEFDETLPRKHWIVDNVFQRARRLQVFRQRGVAAMEQALGLPTLDRTPIIDSLSAVEPVLTSAGQQRRTLVIFSDMLEDSAIAKFVDHCPDPSQLIEARRRSKALPSFVDVEVFVVGASAPTPDRFRSVEQWWQAYFDAANARLAPSHYGAVLLGWPAGGLR